jgi:hypothetical protein
LNDGLQMGISPLLQSVLFNVFALSEHLLCAAQVDILRGQIIKRFVVALGVVVHHKISDGLFQFPGKEKVLSKTIDFIER